MNIQYHKNIFLSRYIFNYGAVSISGFSLFQFYNSLLHKKLEMLVAIINLIFIRK